MASDDVLERATKAQKMIPRVIDVFEQAVFIGSVVDDLAAEVRELRKDKARLDWVLSSPNVDVSFAQSSLAVAVLDTRYEIDAAMGAEG